MRKKVVFLGSKPIGAKCLKWMISQSEILNIDIIGVKTQHRKEFCHEESVLKLAQQYGVTIIDELDNLPNCDIIYSVQHHEILKKNHIEKASQIAVNLHLAPLPEYRGCNQFSFAIFDEAPEFGVSIHVIDEKIDHGALLFEDRFKISAHKWVEDLFNESNERGYDLFTRTLESIVNEKYTAINIKALNRVEGMHYRNEINDLKRIPWNCSEEELDRRIRATSMPGFEMPYVEINGKKIYLISERYNN